MVVVFVRVGRRLGGRVGLVVQLSVVVATLRRRAEVGAAAAQVGAVRGAQRRLEQRLLEVRVRLHVARVWRRPELLVAARVGRRQPAGGVAVEGGRAVRVARAALRLALCAHSGRQRDSIGLRRGRRLFVIDR